MPETRTLNIALRADIDGFAAQLLDSLADQLEVAAESVRASAEAIRDTTRTVHLQTTKDRTDCCHLLGRDVPEGDKVTDRPELVTCTEVHHA